MRCVPFCASHRASFCIGLLALWLGLLLPAPLSARPASPDIADFRHIFAVETPEKSGVYSVRLPVSVYEYARLPHLGDVRVFDSQGQPVPFYITSAAATIRTEEHFFPAYRVRVGISGGTLQLLSAAQEGPLTSPAPSTAPAPSATSTLDSRQQETRRETDALLLDLGEGNTSRAELMVEPDASAGPAAGAGAQEQGTLASVLVYTSRDMRQWSLTGTRVLGAIRSGDLALEHLSLPMPGQRYMLLAPVEGSRLLAMRGVRQVSRHAGTALEQTSFEGTWDDEAQGYLYDLPPFLPVHAFRLTLPAANYQLRGGLWLRGEKKPLTRKERRAGKAEQPAWRWHSAVKAYSVEVNGREYSSPPQTFRAAWLESMDRPLLLLRPADAGWPDTPRLEAQWHVQQLYFVAAGVGPYQLAVGNAAAGTVGGQDPGLSELVARSGAQPAATGTSFTPGITPASVGAPREQADPLPGTYRDKGKSKSESRGVLIWVVLVLGALCMGGMAVQMMRKPRQ